MRPSSSTSAPNCLTSEDKTLTSTCRFREIHTEEETENSCRIPASTLQCESGYWEGQWWIAVYETGCVHCPDISQSVWSLYHRQGRIRSPNLQCQSPVALYSHHSLPVTIVLDKDLKLNIFLEWRVLLVNITQAAHSLWEHSFQETVCSCLEIPLVKLVVNCYFTL